MSESPTLPTWATQIGPAAGATLVTVATNPETFIREIVAEWVVGGFLDALTYVLGWIAFAYERTRTIILDAAPILTKPARLTESTVTGAVELYYGLVRSVADMAGLAGPPAAAFAVGLMALTTGALLIGLLYLIPGSDLVEGTLEGLKR